MDLRLHSREFIKRFIREFQKNPCLWNISNPEYKNKKSRMEAYQRLLIFTKAADPKTTITEIQKKIQSIRASHRKEKRKVNESQKNATNPKDVYVPKLWYYKELEFLNSRRQMEDTFHSTIAGDVTLEKSNDNNDNETNALLDVVEMKQEVYEVDDDINSAKSSISNTSKDDVNLPQETLVSPPATTSKIPRLETVHSLEQKVQNNDTNEILNYIARKLDDNKDEFELFGKNVAAELRKMTDKQRIIAKKLMNDVIFHGHLQHLTVNTQISISHF